MTNSKTADEMANAIANGSATRPTVTPAVTSVRNVRQEYSRSAPTRAGALAQFVEFRLPYFGP